MKQKIAFIGGGNMAEGIIRGMLKEASFLPEEIYVYDIISSRVEFLKQEYKIQGCVSIEEATKEADILVFAVRPQDAENVSVQVKSFLEEKSIFVSICAGVRIKSFEQWIGSDKKIIRVMPNTLTETQRGYTSLCMNGNVDREMAEPVFRMMEAIGRVMEIAEDMFDNFTAYSCTGPAYLLYLMNALIDAGVRTGFSRKDARAITIENMIGTAMKVEQIKKHPFEILDTMTSPGGVGIEGIYTMNEEGIYGKIMHSVEEAARRSKELA
ncbi:MAG: pyrroline-5-carboxylate reductase [Clostridiales bacterium]|nr:pyrroline-5-carboxylate reductase [Clostridiales bacterium]